MKFLFVVCLFLISMPATAKLKVVTTTSNLQAVVRAVGADLIEVESITRGTQDPHYIEAKPSYMVKLREADLLIAIGLGLESGWLPSLVRGSRNPKVRKGEGGRLDMGDHVSVIGKIDRPVTRAQGDIHAEGNPHFLLDPIRAGKVAEKVAERLSQLDAGNAEIYNKMAGRLKAQLSERTTQWQKTVTSKNIKKVITYHHTLDYFLNRMGVDVPTVLEPKPGVPPSGKHILDVIDLVKTQKIRVILVENYFNDKIAQRIAGSAPDVRYCSVPVAVGGAKSVNTLTDLYQALVNAVVDKCS